MGLFSRDIKTMNDLFLHTLQDIYYAEKKIVSSLPDMVEKATNRDLTASFKAHLEETKTHVSRLDQVFSLLNQSPKGTNCPAIDGIIEEANDIAGDVADKEVLDAALIAAAQAVEHYEITRYGTLIAWARELGRKDCASLFEETLAEERAADHALTNLAESRINLKSAA